MSDFTKGPWVLDSRWTHRVFCDDVTGSLVAITAGDEFNFVGRAKKRSQRKRKPDIGSSRYV